MGYFVKNRRLQSGSSGVVLPSGPSSVRPSAPTFGLIRYNTDRGSVEFFDGTQFQTMGTSGELATEVYSLGPGDGFTATYTIGNTTAISNDDQIIVFIGSIYQQPGTTYSITGSGFDITFTSAPPSGETINVIRSMVAPGTP